MSISRRSSGSYTVRVDVDRGVSGKRIRRTVGLFRTRKEAAQAEREALTARDRGIDIAPEFVTIGALIERFIADRAASGRAEKTIVEYRRLAKLYVEPSLGSKSVAKTKPAHIAEWLAVLRKAGGRPIKEKDGTLRDRPLSAKTCALAFALLNGALRWGVRMELCGRNIAAAVSAPSVPKSGVKTFENAEIAALLAAVAGTRWEGYVTLALAVGARRSELLALDWGDVDFERGTVTISKALCQIGGRIFTKGTKTGASRIVPLSRVALGVLRHQRALQAEDRLRVGAEYEPSAAVFTNPVGARLTPQAATSAFAKLARGAGVSATSLHACRHSAATHLLAEGVDLATTAAILGHANAAVTATVYAHVLGGGTRVAVDRLGDRLTRLVNERTSS